MYFDNFLKRLPHFQMHYFAAVALITLTWSMPVFCGPIHNAASLGNLHKVQALLKENPELVSSGDRENRTPLHIAAEMGYGNVAELLLANNADVNAGDDDGNTPLHLAAGQGRVDVMGLLLENKADIDAGNRRGNTPLHRAIWNRQNAAVAFLLDKGAGVDSNVDRLGFTPLHWAAFYNRKEIAELLLSKGAHINARDKEGWTPLHWAAERGEKIVAELLLARGAVGDSTNIPSGTTLNPDPIHVTKPMPGSDKECYRNRDSLRDCYGDPVDAIYRTSRNLIIAPSFAGDGVLCGVSVSADGMKLSDPETSTILADLAPMEARGEYIIGKFLNYDCMGKNDAGEFEPYDCGGASSDYERITITRWGNTNEYRSVQVTYHHRPGCESNNNSAQLPRNRNPKSR